MPDAVASGAALLGPAATLGGLAIRVRYVLAMNFRQLKGRRPLVLIGLDENCPRRYERQTRTNRGNSRAIGAHKGLPAGHSYWAGLHQPTPMSHTGMGRLALRLVALAT